MSDPQVQHEKLLREHGFKLIRQSKHLVYQNPDGKVLVTSATPSDRYAWKNALGTLKRVVAAPAKPLVLAISEFEREQAALVIQGEERRGLGGGSGKQRRSQGTGFYYDDKIEIVDTLPRRQELARLAKENKERKQERRQGRIKDRRAVKLERRAAKSQAEEERERVFNERFSGFMSLCSDILKQITLRTRIRDQYLQDRVWWEGSFYEFNPEHEAALRVFRHVVEWVDDGCELSQESAEAIDRVLLKSPTMNRPLDRLKLHPAKVLEFVRKAIRSSMINGVVPLSLVIDELVQRQFSEFEKTDRQRQLLLSQHGDFLIYDVLYGYLADNLQRALLPLGSTMYPKYTVKVVIGKDRFMIDDGRLDSLFGTVLFEAILNEELVPIRYEEEDEEDEEDDEIVEKT